MTKESIIIADPSKFTREATQEWLEKTLSGNYHYEHFNNGMDLSSRLIGEDSSNVVLLITEEDLDYGPKGTEIIQRISRKVSFPSIFYCWDDDDHVKNRVLEVGAEGFYKKPFSHPDLAYHVKQLLEREEFESTEL